MPQNERLDILSRLRGKLTASLLVSTDVIARGLDNPHITLVIHYDLPSSRALYLHRSGRAGRFGRKAVILTFVNRDEIALLRDIEQFYSLTIDEMPQVLDL